MSALSELIAESLRALVENDRVCGVVGLTELENAFGLLGRYDQANEGRAERVVCFAECSCGEQAAGAGELVDEIESWLACCRDDCRHDTRVTRVSFLARVPERQVEHVKGEES